MPLAEVEKTLRMAQNSKRFWIVDPSNHRFSGNLAEFDARLLEAIDWVRHNGAHREDP